MTRWVAEEKSSLGEFMNDEDRGWEAEWQDMPEFVQPKQECYAKVVVRFSCQADVDDFAKIIGQAVTNKTRAIWHPRSAEFNSGTKKKIV